MKLVMIVVVVVVAALGVTAELAAPALVEARVEERVEAHTGTQARVVADARSHPFLPALLLDGRMDRLALTVDEIAGVELPLTRATFELEGILLDRDELFAGSARVTDIERGRVSALLDSDELGTDLLPEMLDIGGDVVSLAGAQLPIPSELLPCTPQVERTDEGLLLTCTFEEVPGVLVRAMAR